MFAGLAIVRYFALRNAKDSVLKPFMLTCKRADEKVLLKKPDKER